MDLAFLRRMLAQCSPNGSRSSLGSPGKSWEGLTYACIILKLFVTVALPAFYEHPGHLNEEATFGQVLDWVESRVHS